MKSACLFPALLLFLNIYSQEVPYMIWEYEHGDEVNHQWAQNTVQTSNGGYFVLYMQDDMEGETNSNYGLARLSPEGEELWVKTFGGNNSDTPVKILKAATGNFVLLGHSRSNDGDLSHNYGDFDIWIVMIDESGTILWEKNYGGSQAENAADIAEDTEGGFVVLGMSNSSDGDVSENKGYSDYWLFKISETGDLIWEKTYGGSTSDWTYSLIPANGGGWLVSGSSTSTDGDISNPFGKRDVWVIKVNAGGELLWEKSIGDAEDNWNYGMIADHSQSGGYLVFGRTEYDDLEVIHGFLVKINDEGDLLWQSDSEKFITNMALGNYPNYIWASMEDSGIGGEFLIFRVLAEEVNSDWETIWSYEVGYCGWWKPSFYPYDLTFNNDDKIVITGSKGSDYFSKAWVGLISPGQMNTRDLENLSVWLYPNPAQSFVYMNSSEPVRKVNVYNAAGKLIIQREFYSEKIIKLDIRHLIPGPYFVSVTTEKEIHTIPLLVK